MKFVMCSIAVLAFMFGMTATSCSKQPDSSGDELTAYTILYELMDDGFYQFKSNNKRFYNYCFWKYWDGTNMNRNGTIIEAQVMKTSGCSNYGYGVVFGFKDFQNFYYFLITIEGWFTIRAVTNGQWFPLWNWVGSAALNKGYGMINTLKVSNRFSTGTYEFYINNVHAFSTTKTNLTGENHSGFITFMGDVGDENFPYVPVDCRYKMLFGRLNTND